MSDSDDEKIELSGDALAALQDFYSERDAREKQFLELKTQAEDEEGERKLLSMDAFTENWQDSQFWYSDETATTLAKQLLKGTTKENSICVISAPSVFIQLKNILNQGDIPKSEQPNLYLLEFDERFNVFPEFVFYDFKSPFKLPPAMKGSIDHIICDPPFLSEDCQTKAALTVRWLSKSWGNTSQGSRLILCTGERMETLITKVYKPQGVKTTTFEPVHSKGLSNEFFCYANFECEDWKWK